MSNVNPCVETLTFLDASIYLNDASLILISEFRNILAILRI